LVFQNKKQQYLDPIEKYILKEMQESKGVADDEDRLFALSIVPCLKRLAPHLKMEAKIKIQQVLQAAEFGIQSSDRQYHHL
jgi:hypothetical protein